VERRRNEQRASSDVGVTTKTAVAVVIGVTCITICL